MEARLVSTRAGKYMGDAMFPIWLDPLQMCSFGEDFTQNTFPYREYSGKKIYWSINSILMPLQDIGHHARELNYNTL